MFLPSLFITLMVLAGCGSTDFAASEQPLRRPPIAAPQTPSTPNNPFQPYVPPPYNPSLPNNPLPNPTLPTPTLPTPVLRPPTLEQPNNSAVSRGSFTIWTDPADPVPGQYYDIIIEVKLPSNVSSYSQSDLTGCVIGTDHYAYAIGRGDYIGSNRNFTNCSQVYAASASDFEHGYKRSSFRSATGFAQLTIPIPGAIDLVRDRIEVRSQLLNESQTISIEF